MRSGPDKKEKPRHIISFVSLKHCVAFRKCIVTSHSARRLFFTRGAAHVHELYNPKMALSLDIFFKDEILGILKMKY